ncbi:MAG TPA: hypothetical protein VIL74_18805 [Pyrinomonadaceae bacterium]|jgi:hypothetical protein
MIERADGWNEQKSKLKGQRSKSDTRRLVSVKDAGIDFSQFLSGSNLSFRLKEMAEENRAFGAAAEDYVQDIWRETAFLQTVAADLDKPLTAKSVLAFRCSDIYFGKTAIPEIFEIYKKLFAQELGLKTAELVADKIETDHFVKFLALEGAFAAALARGECGNHVFVSKRGGFTPVEIEIFEPGTDQTLADFPRIYTESTRRKRPSDFNVVRLYNERLLALDFRSALMTRDALTARELRTFILSGLTAPPEFTSISDFGIRTAD